MTRNRKSSRKIFLMFIWFFSAFCAQAVMLNEWNFYSDLAGNTLSQATNTAGSIRFSSGNETELATDGIGALLCTQNDSGSTSGMWTHGAILDATLPSAVHAGVQYLRYDFSYDLSSSDNDSGCVAGFAFYDATSNEVAGVVLGYDVGAGAAPIYPTTQLTEMTNTIGTISVVARINLTNQTLSVWYDLTGDVSGFSESSPATNVTVLLSSFDSLRFQATGDIQPVGSSDHVAVDLLRMADRWEDVFVADPAAPPALQIQVADSQFGSMEPDETNIVSVIIRNAGGVATNVTSALSHDKVPSAFTVTSDNTAQTLWPDELMTNTYTVVANTNGGFVFTAQAFIAGTGDISTNLNVVVGSQISYLTNSIAVVSTNGLFADDYEPGEIIDITVISTNDGAKVVSNIVNSLSVDSDYFSISNRTSTLYSSMAAGDTTSTVYRVTLDPATPHGTYSFNVTNAAGAKVWPGAFPIHVLNQGIPFVSPGALVFSVTEGDTELQTVTVSNAGNATLSFTINDNAAWENLVTTDVGAAPSEMEPGGTVIDLVDPEPSNQWVSAETDGESDTLDIGFSFPLQGTDYTKFYIDSNGAIFLSTTNRSADYASSMGSATLPIGSSPMIAPLRDKQMMIPAGSVRYLVKSNPQRLVIVHDGLSNNSLESTDLQFQTELFADGQIKFSYFNINGQYVHFAAVGFQADENNFVNIETVPASGTAVLINSTEDAWVRYDPDGGMVLPGGSMDITFTADAASQAAGASSAFTTTFLWGDIGSDDVTVNASVVAAVPKLETVAAVLFEGPAGEITTMILDLTNSGKAALNFTITDTGSFGSR